MLRVIVSSAVAITSLTNAHILQTIMRFMIQHIALKEPNIVCFDFLGKDSMPYHNEVAVDDLVYTNFSKMIQDKRPCDKLFDLLTVCAMTPRNNRLRLYLHMCCSV
jgi:hypothetical protein